jgi:Mce-associated membrane protein
LTGVVNAAHGPRAIAALALVLGVLGLVAVVLAIKLAAARGEEARRAEILQAAREHATNVTTYDFASIDADTARVLAAAAGDFKTSYQAGAARLKAVVLRNRSVAAGSVLEAGIVSAGRDAARVLVVGDTTVTAATARQPQVRPFRMQLQLVRRGERWLASDLRFVG